LEGTTRALLTEFGIQADRAAPLDALIRRARSRFEHQVAGYRRLFDKLRPKAVLFVQNGIGKALFHVARTEGVPVIEVQHGYVGHGHPVYSYSREIDYHDQTAFPDLFL